MFAMGLQPVQTMIRSIEKRIIVHHRSDEASKRLRTVADVIEENKLHSRSAATRVICRRTKPAECIVILGFNMWSFMQNEV